MKLNFFAILLVLFGINALFGNACSYRNKVVEITANDGVNGLNGGSCHTKQLMNGSLIQCDDGSFSYLYNGTNGVNGLNGLDGRNGDICNVYSNTSGATVTCGENSVTIYNGTNGTNGKDGVNGTNGTNGKDGVNGTNGTNGKDGASCSLQTVTNGVVISCPNNETGILVTNGTNGIDGKDGKDGAVGPAGPAGSIEFTFVDPCAGTTKASNERIMQTSSGQWLMISSSGQLMVITSLTPSTVTKINNQQCKFYINSSNNAVMAD